ncbi:MAG: TonB family protein [Candidatus Obscuribacterales bacterium]|jgi:TonB family protein
MHSIKITAANLSQSVFIETPCTADWNDMTGNESVRFCHSCKLNVYNISQFSDSEAEEIFAQNLNGNRMCTRLYRRPDGTIMTDNCPRALRRLRDLRNKTFSAIAKVAALATLFLTAFMPQASAKDNDREKAPQPNKSKSLACPLPPVQPVVSPDYAKSARHDVIAGVPMMPDLSNYMQQLNSRLLETWKKAGNPKPGNPDQLPTSVSFTIDNTGAISKLKVIKSAKQAAVDDEALKAVKNSLPLPRPPANSGPLDVEFTFDPKLEQQSKEKNDGH